MHQMLIYIWRITNEDSHNRFIQNLRKITLRVAMFCVKKFQGVRFFRFLLCYALKLESLIYRTVIKTQLQRSHLEQRKNRLHACFWMRVIIFQT